MVADGCKLDKKLEAALALVSQMETPCMFLMEDLDVVK